MNAHYIRINNLLISTVIPSQNMVLAKKTLRPKFLYNFFLFLLMLTNHMCHIRTVTSMFNSGRGGSVLRYPPIIWSAVVNFQLMHGHYKVSMHIYTVFRSLPKYACYFWPPFMGTNTYTLYIRAILVQIKN